MGDHDIQPYNALTVGHSRNSRILLWLKNYYCCNDEKIIVQESCSKHDWKYSYPSLSFTLPSTCLGPDSFFWLKGSTNYVHSTMKFSLCLRNHSTKSLKYKMLPSSHLYKIQLCISFKIWGRFVFLLLLFWVCLGRRVLLLSLRFFLVWFSSVQAQRTSKACTQSLSRFPFLLFYLFTPFWLQK